MKRIGLVGEDPNDTTSVRNLLLKKYKGRFKLFHLAKNIRGYQLDNPKTINTVKFDFNNKKCDLIIFIRDLDGFKSEQAKVKKKNEWFNNLNSVVNNKGILFLNIWELEALILADIHSFNKIFKSEIKFPGDPMAQKEPKEFLKEKTINNKRKYTESDCPEIFEELDFKIIYKKCKYFKEFIDAFDEKLKKKSA